ncbi:MAG: hypothetical protein LUF33_02845 [Clostridiales bacterium]|nr:hypothetical protein [Clostridiales bacterium]
MKIKEKLTSIILVTAIIFGMVTAVQTTVNAEECSETNGQSCVIDAEQGGYCEIEALNSTEQASASLNTANFTEIVESIYSIVEGNAEFTIIEVFFVILFLFIIMPVISVIILVTLPVFVGVVLPVFYIMTTVKMIITHSSMSSAS